MNLIYTWKIDNISQDKNYILVDLRDKESYMRYHIYGAINVTFDNILDNNYNLPKGKRLVFICDRGNVSMRAALIMERRGYETYSLVGGMKEYKRFN